MYIGMMFLKPDEFRLHLGMDVGSAPINPFLVFNPNHLQSLENFLSQYQMHFVDTPFPLEELRHNYEKAIARNPVRDFVNRLLRRGEK